MADFDDLSFDPGPPPSPPAPEPASGPALWPPIVIAVLVAVLAALWYFGTRHAAAPAPAAAASNGVAQTTVDLTKQPARLAAEPGEAIDLPPLDQSDAVVRTLVARLSSHPVVAAWLTTDGLVRNLAVVVANVADGETPAKHLRPVRPTGGFATRQSDGLTWIHAASYARYDAIAAAVDSLDARGVARFYATVKPRVTEAYRDLGTDGDVDRALERAIVMLLKTPVLPDDVQVRAGKVTYEFADPAIEGLPKAQRQLLRMGPRNVRIVQAKVREVARYLGIPDSRLQ